VKPHKLVSSKTLSSPGGVADVSFGASTPERRRSGDHSKDGIQHVAPDAYDDYKEREKRWAKGFHLP
jgi:hypothetical protein